VAERICYREQKKKGKFLEVHLLHFLKSSPVWRNRALWETLFWDTLAHLQNAGAQLPAQSARSTEREGKLSKERSARSVLGIFGMNKDKVDRSLRDPKISLNSSASDDSDKIKRKRKDKEHGKESDTDGDELGQERDECEQSGKSINLKVKEEQLLLLTALQKVGCQMVDWDMPSPFLHDTLTNICRLISLDIFSLHEVLVLLLPSEIGYCADRNSDRYFHEHSDK